MADFFGDMYPDLFGEKKNSPGFISDVKRGTGQVVSAFGSTLQDLGAEDLGSDIEAYGEKVVRRNPSQINTVEEAISSPFTTAREAVGEVVPQVGTAIGFGLGGRVIGGALGSLAGPVGTAVGQQVGGVAGAYLGNLAQSYGGIRAEQRASGDNDIARAIGAGATSAFLDTALGAERVATKVLGKGTSFIARESGEKLLPHVAKQFGRGFAEEAGTEAVQTGIERFGAFKDLTSEEALNEYGLAAIKGGFGGGAIRGGLSSVAGERRDGSLLTNANLDQNIGGTAEVDAITKAINPGANLSTLDLINQNVNVRSVEKEEQNRRRADVLAAFNEPSGQRVTDPETGLERELTAYEAQQLQLGNPVQQAVQQATTNVAQAQQQEAKTGEELAKMGFVFGASTNDKGITDIAGKRLYGPQQTRAFMSELAQSLQGRSQLDMALAGAAVKSGLAKITDTGNVKQLINKIGKVLDTYQVGAVETAEQAAEILNDQISRLEGASALKEADKINSLYASLTGQMAPAYATLQQQLEQTQKGNQDERLQLQNTAGLRAVPEQGRTTETGGGKPGSVRPSEVRPIGAGSNIALQNTEQNVGQGNLRARPQPSASGVSNAVPNAGQAQPQGQVNVTPSQAQTGRVQLPDQNAERNAEATESSEDRAERLVKSIINNIIDTVVVRKGRMSKENLAKLKEFIYYDFYQVGSKDKDGLAKKDLADMYKVSTDTIDGWQKIARGFFDENRGVIQQKILEALSQNNLTLNDLIAAVQARRDKVENEAVILEEGQALAEVEREDEEAAKSEVKEVAATDQELTEEGVLDQRDLAGDNVGMSVNTGRVQQSIQEQGKPEETVNARMKRLLEQYNEAVNSGDEELEAKLMADIDALTKEAKNLADKQVRKSEALAPKKKAAPKERKKRAVQEPSTEKVSVRKRAESSERVRKEDAEKREATTEGKTDEEIWDSLNTPVKYAELTPQAKADWMLSVKEGKTNLAAANKVFEQNEGAITVDGKKRASMVFSKQDIMTSSSTKEKLSVTTASFNELIEAFPGLKSVKEQYESLGIGQAIDAVEQWMVTNSPVKWDAIITLQDGKVTVIVNQEAFSDKTVAAVAGSHEIGHAVDYAITHSGVYSASPSFNLYIGKDGQIKGMGDIAKELIGLYNTDSNWKFLLGYPLDRKEHGDLDADAVREELFAQLWSYMTNATGREYLQQTAPQTFAFMQGVVNDVKKQTYGQAVRQTLGGPQQGKVAQQRQTDTGTEGRIQEVSTGARESRQAVQLETIRRKGQERIDRMPPAYRNTAQKLYDFLVGRNLSDRLISTFAFTQDVVARAVNRGLTSAAVYKRLDDARKEVLARWSVQVEDTLKDFNKLKPQLQGTGENTVNKFLKDSTMEGKWGFKPEWLKEDVAVDPVMAARFEALGKVDPLAQKVIKAVFKFNYEVNEAMKKVVVDNTSTEFDALIKQAKDQGDEKEVKALQKQKAASLSEYQTLLSMNAKKPYASLKRFGNIVVVAKSQEYLDAEKDKDSKKLKELETQEKHYVVRFFESNSEAQKAYRDMESMGYAYLTKPFDSADASEANVYGGRDLNGLFYRLRNMANSEGNDKASLGLNKLLNDLHLRLLSEQSARQSENRRRNITGADDDMMRSFASQGKASAHFLSSLHNSGKIYDALMAMRKERDKDPQTKDITSIYYNEIMARHGLNLVYNPTPIVDAALTVTSTWMLLTSPAYYLQNATQPWLLSLPYMSARYKNAASTLLDAYKDISSVVGKTGITQAEYDKLPADVRGAIEELVNRGTINISLSSEIGRFRSSIGQTKDVFEKAGNAYSKATDFLRGAAENLESVNRVATAVAAFRLAVKDGMSTDKAVDYAEEVINNTHGDYSNTNAPRFMRTGLGRIATQFRKFQLIQISLLARMWNDWRNSADPKVRKIAKRQLMFTLGHTFAVGGMMGLPGFTAIAAVAGALFGDEDEPDNPELFLREMIGDPFLADLLVKGAPAAFGVDLSGKLGMGQMLSVLPYTDLKMTKQSYQEAMLALFGGPFAGGLAPRVVNGLSYMAAGDYWKGVEQLLPKGLSDAAKGVRLATEGVTDKRGDVLLSADEINFLEATLTGLGLPTTDITKQQFKRGVQIEAEKFYSERTTEMKREYAKAAADNDTQRMNELRQEWMDIQEKRKKYGQPRQPLSDLLKARTEQLKRQAKNIGGVQYTGSNRGLAERLNKI